MNSNLKIVLIGLLLAYFGLLAPVSAAEYGPIKAGDSLWRIAKDMNTDASLSTAKVVQRLHQHNPGAFINNDINLLKKGAMLRLPGPVEAVVATVAAAPAQPDLSVVAETQAQTAIVANEVSSEANAETTLPAEVAPISATPEAVQASTIITPPPVPVAEPIAETPVLTPASETTVTAATVLPQTAIETAPPLAETATAAPSQATTKSPTNNLVLAGILLAIICLAGGFLLFLRNRKQTAQATFHTHESVDTFLERSEQEMMEGNYNVAVSAMRQAIAIAPARPELRILLMEMRFAQGDEAIFVAEAAELQILFPENEGGVLWGKVMAMAAQLCPDHPMFAKNTEEASNVQPEPMPTLQPEESVAELLERAALASEEGNYNVARSILRQAIASQADDPQMRLKLLTVEYAQGDAPSFLVDAEELYEMLDDPTSKVWTQVLSMAKVLCPDEPLFHQYGEKEAMPA